MQCLHWKNNVPLLYIYTKSMEFEEVCLSVCLGPDQPPEIPEFWTFYNFLISDGKLKSKRTGL